MATLEVQMIGTGISDTADALRAAAVAAGQVEDASGKAEAATKSLDKSTKTATDGIIALTAAQQKKIARQAEDRADMATLQAMNASYVETLTKLEAAHDKEIEATNAARTATENIKVATDRYTDSMAAVNAQMTQYKTSSAAVVQGYNDTATAATGAKTMTAQATREFIVLGHEVMTGNF